MSGIALSVLLKYRLAGGVARLGASGDMSTRYIDLGMYMWTCRPIQASVWCVSL